jgi:3-hexulose-6-phosphate synthase/6-phospho-3-hexuloisomerase
MDDHGIVKKFETLSTPDISDSLGRFNSMVGIMPIVKGLHLAGIALTVKMYPGDELAVKIAIDKHAKDDDVIVVDSGGLDTAAVAGGLMARKCIMKGVKGMVIDGYTRDVDDIEKLGFPIFAKGLTPNSAVSRFEGKINVPIQCGGILVRPEDFVIGDNNGVVVVPRISAEEVLKNAMRIKMLEGGYISSLEEQNWEKCQMLADELGKVKKRYRSAIY